jgi:SAM-dependent methyltransferase
MEEYLYPHFYEVEKSHWWFAARRAILLEYLERRAHLTKSSRILDVGCGTGAILEEFARRYTAFGLDFSPSAIDFCRKRGLPSLFAGTLSDYRVDVPFDVVTMLDVVEHVDDDLGLLRDGHRLLRGGGTILITVPAFPALWSGHDVELHHKRRYVKAQLKSLVEAAGFQIDHLSYFNCFLLPVAIGKRMLAKLLRTKEASDLEIPAAPVNAVLRRVFEFERHILPSASLPFGLSLICLGRKHAR